MLTDAPPTRRPPRRVPGRPGTPNEDARLAIVAALVSYQTANHGQAPSTRQLAALVNYGLSVVHYHLVILERAGRVVRVGHTYCHPGTWTPTHAHPETQPTKPAARRA